MTSSPSGARRAGLPSACGIGATIGLSAGLLPAAALGAFPSLDAPVGGAALLWLFACAVVITQSFAHEQSVDGYLATPKSRLGTIIWSFTAACLLGEIGVAAGGAVSFAVYYGLQALPGLAIESELVSLSGHGIAAGLALLIAIVGLFALPGIGRGSVLFGALTMLLLLLVTVATASQPDITDRGLEPLGVLAYAPLASVWVSAAVAPAFVPPRRRAVALASVSFAVAVSLVTVVGGLGLWVPGAVGVLDVALRLCLLAAVGLALHHRLVAGYTIAATMDRSGLLPRSLLQRSERLGTPLRLVLLLGGSSAGVALFLEPIQILVAASSLAGAGLMLFSFTAAVRFVRARRFVSALLSPCAMAGAAVLLWAAVAWRPVPGLVALGAAAAVSVASLIWRRLSKRLPHLRAEAVEMAAAASPSSAPILTLHEALEVVPRYRPRVLIATLEGSWDLIDRGAHRADDDDTIFVLFVDELPGMFYPPQVAPSAQAVEVLLDICGKLDGRNIQGVPIWRVAHDPAASIAQAARALEVERVLVDVPERAPLREVFRGQTLGRLRKLLGHVSLEVVRPAVREP